jgi:protein SCO1/2
MLQNVKMPLWSGNNRNFGANSNSMSKKLAIYLVFFTLLLAGFYYFLFRGTDNWRPKLTTLGYVKPFKFTTQNGKSFTNEDLKGKVTVVQYFFTTCKGICPRMHESMRSIYEANKSNPDFLIVAHTCNPETDSVARLKKYADSLQIDTKKWVLLTGRKDSLYQMARSSYLLDDPKNNVEKIEDQFIHTQFFALVDRNGKVRGQVYDALKQTDLQQLQIDLKKLLAESISGTFVNGVFTNNPQ